MKIIIHSHALGGTDLEAEFEEAENSEGIMLLFHNASGDMNNEILLALASSCSKRNISSLRCNFHYVNGVGSEKAEWKDVAYDAEAIYAKAKELDGGFLYVGGKSLGTLAALHLATLHPEIKAVGLFAVPIRMIEKYLDLEELSNIKMPVYVFHGDDDKVGTSDEVESFLDSHIGNKIHMKVMPARGHGFEHQNTNEENKELAEEMVSSILTP